MVSFVRLRVAMFTIFVTFSMASSAQRSPKKDTATYPDTYHVNYWVSGAGILAGGVTTILGHDRIRQKQPISQERMDRLNVQDVWGIDRIALRQDPTKYERAREQSDIGLEYGPYLPLLLFIDRGMRKDWIDITLVYIETQVVMSNFYNWSPVGPLSFNRFRPVVYYDEVDFVEKTWGGNRNSWYSGHTSTVATSTFFMVQAFLDYHPEKAHNKWLYYSLAALPPAYIGFRRIQGLKHYPTDVLGGLVVGAATGLLWPRLHRGNGKRSLDVSMLFEPEMKMLRLSYQF